MSSATSSLESVCLPGPFALPKTQAKTAGLSTLIAGRSNGPIVETIGPATFFVGHSQAMREVRALVDLIAQTSLPVLILGESGTGKEVVARLIHCLSLRAKFPFVKINCAALPPELLESELFGYEAGAFTGATKSRAGKFEACHKGTILLDEIAEMAPASQAKLLHVLQDGEFHRLGSPDCVQVDVRVLAATNVDIARTIRGKRFREDLYYRLNAFTIQLLPLRERKQDIPVLMQHFIEEYARRLNREPLPISEPLLNACLRYSWPGNARELENIVKRYLILRDEKKILSQLDPEGPYVRCCSKNPFPIDAAEPSDLKTLTRGLKQQAERQAIARTLEYVNGSRKEAARLLNISSRALLYKMREYGLGRIAGESAVEAVA